MLVELKTDESGVVAIDPKAVIAVKPYTVRGKQMHSITLKTPEGKTEILNVAVSGEEIRKLIKASESKISL